MAWNTEKRMTVTKLQKDLSEQKDLCTWLSVPNQWKLKNLVKTEHCCQRWLGNTVCGFHCFCFLSPHVRASAKPGPPVWIYVWNHTFTFAEVISLSLRPFVGMAGWRAASFLLLLLVLPASAQNNTPFMKQFLLKLDEYARLVEEQTQVIENYKSTTDALNRTIH